MRLNACRRGSLPTHHQLIELFHFHFCLQRCELVFQCGFVKAVGYLGIRSSHFPYGSEKRKSCCRRESSKKPIEPNASTGNVICGIVTHKYRVIPSHHLIYLVHIHHHILDVVLLLRKLVNVKLCTKLQLRETVARKA